MQKDFLTTIPTDLPIPVDDGACDGLLNKNIPSVDLQSTKGVLIDPSTITGLLVIFCYPMTGRPGRLLPRGWIDTPGAAGCTPQNCSFRDRFIDLTNMDVTLFGLSAQTHTDQAEAVLRLKFPYTLLSDSDLKFTDSLNLPTFKIENLRLNKRVTLIVKDGIIKKYFYPVFPPDKNVEDVINWISTNK